MRQTPALLIGRQSQITAGHCGYQTDLRRTTRLLGLQIRLQHLVLQVLHPPEKIQLVGAEAQRGVITVRNARRTGIVFQQQIARHLAVGSRQGSINRGKQRGPDNAVLGLRLHDIRAGNP